MTDYKVPSYEDIVRIERDARRLQAITLSAGLRAMGRRVVHAPQSIGALMSRRVHG